MINVDQFNKHQADMMNNLQRNFDKTEKTVGAVFIATAVVSLVLTAVVIWAIVALVTHFT